VRAPGSPVGGRRGYNRVRVTTVSKAVYEGYRDVFINYDPTNSDAVRVEKAPIPSTTVDVRGTGTVRMECLRSKKSPWYSSRDSSRTVLSNTTRVYRLPLGNPARCRISVGLSAYNFGSDFVANDPYASVKATYSLVRVQVQSVR